MHILAASSDTVTSLFELLALVIGAALITSLLLIKIRQSIIIGYFLCGVLVNIGSKATGLHFDGVMISTMADIGVVLLLFTLGIEFSIKELARLRRIALVIGSVQMGLVTALAWAIALGFGLSVELAFFIGFLIAMSSTALSLKMFQSMGIANAPSAHIALGVAIFQDILVIGFILILPHLFPEATEAGSQMPFILSMLLALAKAVLFLLVTWALGHFVVPHLLGAVAKTRIRELFTLMVIGLCVGIGFLGHQFGLSIALGAFVAGLVVSESVYSHRILADILPFKDFFMTVFFVSVGLMIDIDTFLSGWYIYLGVAIAIIVVKTLIAFLASRLLRFSVHDCLMAAVSLSSIGEFSLVLVDSAFQMEVIDESMRQFFLITAALSMSMIPFLMRLSQPFGLWLESKPWFKPTKQVDDVMESTIEAMHDHAIVCGFGPVGQGLVHTFQKKGVVCLVVELNALTVRDLKEEGQPCVFADITQNETMRLAHAESCRLIAVTFPSLNACKSVISWMRHMNPEAKILCRTKFAHEAKELHELGADVVIQDEKASAVAMIRESMKLYEYPEEDIELAVHDAQNPSPLIEPSR